MQIPNSILQAGFTSPTLMPRSKIRLKNGQILKPILIGTQGITDSGKTEWALSAPGNIQMVNIDRNIDGVFDNATPPTSRNPNVMLKVIQVPLEGQAKIPEYQNYHINIKQSIYSALDEPFSQVVVVDGDSDWWDIHILAHFGKTTQIYPQTRYGAPNAEKRAIITKMWDSGKIVICTNKVRDEYETVLDAAGNPVKDSMGENKQQKTGRKRRQGYSDQDYLYDMQLEHMYQPPTTRKVGSKFVDLPQQWGVKVLKCKANMALVGSELWGDECCFLGVMQLCYPEVPIERWGF